MSGIWIFASGQGTNAENIIKKVEQGFIPTRILGVLTDRSEAGVIDRCRRLQVGVRVVPRHKGQNAPQHEAQILSALLSVSPLSEISWIILAGYQRILTQSFLNEFAMDTGLHRVVNIHPSLLPAFAGANAMEQAFNSGVKVSGTTVHLVDSGVDTGPILDQIAVDVSRCHDFEQFQAKIHEAEYELYPQVLKNLILSQFRFSKTPKGWRAMCL